jgi:phosphate starvation-inducible PhoH-like protein
LNSQPVSSDFILQPADNQRLANLCGQFDEHLRQIEKRLGVKINVRGNALRVIGEIQSVRAAGEILKGLYEEASKEALTPNLIHLYLQEAGMEAEQHAVEKTEPEEIIVRTRRATIKARGHNQRRYLKNIMEHDINFGIGPAGTGKTYLAVACAVAALETDRVSRLVLTRPAVEAGERLGFLPGDMAQKIDPYLRPLYDALYELMGFETVEKLIDHHVIEIAPLAFMRGRTLNEAFIILDEAQNTTSEQMKMFLTRIGFGSTAVITGDITQIDLPKGTIQSGLYNVMDVLKNEAGISFTRFQASDAVRHPLVQRIVSAYEKYEKKRDKRDHGDGTKDGINKESA